MLDSWKLLAWRLKMDTNKFVVIKDQAKAS